MVRGRPPKKQIIQDELEVQYKIHADKCLEDFKYFCCFTFYQKYGFPFKLNHHHYEMFETLEAVFRGEITRLIINIPPRYSKTEICSIAFPAWAYAHNPACKFIHTSYEQDLVLLNSSKTLDILRLEAYKAMFPETRLEKERPSMELWKTSKFGEFYAVSAGSGVTGFGAGDIYDSGNFSGGIIIDDPHKVQNINSDVERKSILNWFTQTLYSRMNNKNIPIILVMQRLHEEDLTGFLLGGGTADKWHHLCLPAIDEQGQALWTFKHNIRDLKNLQITMGASAFAGQMQQAPSPAEGGIFKDEYWRYYKKEVNLAFDFTIMTVDCAEKEKEQNDFTVFQIWGKYMNRAYLVDQLRIKTEGINIHEHFKAFYDKHRPRICYVEDKSSGTGLIQYCKKHYSIPIVPVGQSISKYERAKDIEPYLMQNLVYIPEGEEWMSDYLYEHKVFPNGKHDDQVDCTSLGIKMVLQSSGLILYPEFNIDAHVASDIEYNPKYPLIIGYSTQKEPVCLFSQYDPTTGQLIFLEEFVCDSLDVRRKEEFVEQIRIAYKYQYDKSKKIILLNYADEKAKSNLFDWDSVFEKKHGVMAMGYDLEDCLDDLINKTADIMTNNVYNRYNNKSEKRFRVHEKCELLIKALSGGLTFQNKDKGYTITKDLVKDFPYYNLGQAMHNIVYDIFLSQEIDNNNSNSNASVIVRAGY